MTTRSASPASPAETQSNAWMPTEPGDTITGTVAEVDQAWSTFRHDAHAAGEGWYPLLILDGVTVNSEPVEGTRALHAFRTVLFNLIMRRQPLIGERITVTFVGEGKAKGGKNPAHIYRLTIDGRPADEAKSVYAAIGGPAPLGGSDVPSDAGPEDELPF